MAPWVVSVLEKFGLLTRAIGSFILAGVLCVPGTAGAQVGKVYRIGALHEAWAPNYPAVEGLRTGLKAIGLEEGRDLVIDNRFTEGNYQVMPVVAADLVGSGVDLIFTTHEPSTKAAMAATRKIPIVFSIVSDPAASGIVKDIAHPSGNVTGVTSLGAELMPKRIEILKAVVPNLRRIWFIYAADDPIALRALSAVQEAAPLLKLKAVVRPARSAEEVARVLAEVRPGDGLMHPLSVALDIPNQIWLFPNHVYQRLTPRGHLHHLAPGR